MMLDDAFVYWPRLTATPNRQAILAGLKKNWEDLLHEYQGLSVVVDNLSKKLHKKSLEEKLAQVGYDVIICE